MNPKLVIKTQQYLQDAATENNYKKLLRLQKKCEHDIAFKHEWFLELPEYECMLCKKKFEGYGSKNRLPENTYVVPYRLMSYMNQFYENIIERISLTYSKHPEINIVQIIKDLEPVLMELDNTMMNSETIQDLDNENYKKR